MDMSRRGFLALAGAASAMGLAACRGNGKSDKPEDVKVNLNEYKKLAIDDSAWNYDETNDCYYQLGLPYCTDPAAGSYESLAIYVPGAYFKGEKSGDTYRCKIASDARVGSFTPKTAPVVMPINSARLSAQSCPTAYSYEGLGTYLKKGLVYVYAGFRGRSGGYVSDSSEQYSGGAPWPVVDLKAAVRYLRYNAESLPCNAKRLFVFGYGAGGGVSACLGALGDCGIFTPYLSKIGAAMHDADGKSISDRVFGSASWCPITSYDTADSGYEWMMGQFAEDGARADGQWTKALSDDLATAYGKLVNELGLTGADDKALRLEPVQDGSYLSGTYYDYMLQTIEGSAEKFFSTTSFPYTYTPGRLVDPAFPGDPNINSDSAVEIDVMTGAVEDASGGAGEKDAASAADGTAAASGASSQADSAAADGNAGTTADGSATAKSGDAGAGTSASSGVTVVQSTVYNDAESYVSALNGDDRWITYSPSAGGVTITSMWDFVKHCRPAQKGVCAFDALDRSTTSNQLFGVDDESSLHFDETVATLLGDNADKYSDLKGWKDDLVSDWAQDIVKLDSLKTDMQSRVNAMNPLYALSGHYAGFGSCEVAPHWRINTGLFQSATALCADVNLAVALGAYDGVKDVAFTPVWGRGFELAETSGDAQENFVSWVTDCCK